MRSLFRTIATLGFLLAVFFGQIVCINVLPYPYNHIDVVFVALWWYTFVRADPKIWWLVVILGLTTELYSSTPFGLTTIALYTSLRLGNWLVLHVFTSHAWHVILFATLCTLILYHSIFLVLLLIHHSIYGIPWNVSGPFFASTMIGILLSVLLMVLLYTAGRIYSKRLRPIYTTI